jgi:hypothetical protein
MISITITADAKDATAFLVNITGKIRNPRALNAALAARLEDELKAHFDSRNSEPNKMGAEKTGFWSTVAQHTATTEIRADGATVSIGSNTHFRIHYLGGVIKPTGGRKFLTIPLIKEARGIRAAVYEQTTGRKLFRPGKAKVLMERSGEGDRSLVSGAAATVRTKNGFRKINVGARTRMRAVYALATQVTIHQDPRALPPREALAAALQAEGNAWAATLKGGSK